MNRDKLLERITSNPEIFGGKPIIRGHRLALIEDRKHAIPYDAILDYVEVVIECVDQNLPYPELPEDLIVKAPAPLERP